MLNARRHCRRLHCPLTLLLTVILIGLGCRAANAFDDQPEQKPQTTAAEVLSVSVRNSHLGYAYYHTGGDRYFVTEILLTNRSDEEIEVPMPSIGLLSDRVEYQPDREHPRLTGHEFRVNGTVHRFSQLPHTEVLSISPGATGSTWLVYTELPRGVNVPDMELRFEFQDVAYSFDVDAHYNDLLALDVQRIGPREALGLLTIGGKLNTINIDTLVQAIDRLAASQVSRVVVSFGDSASEVDVAIANWLRERADGNQTTRNFPVFPTIVSTIREFHLSEIPTGGSSGRSSTHEHQSTAAAVEAALASAYRGLPPEDIVEQIERGHPLAQASALASGGSQLPPRYLPLLVDRTGAPDRLIRRGAYIALGGSGDPAAIDALARGAQSDEEVTATIAVECLAASRYSDAHDRLKTLLKEPLHVSGSDLVRILARHPRRQWSGYLSGLARDEDASADPVVRQEVLRALGRVGHPELTEILAGALDEPGVRDTAFHLLLSRDDALSEQIALEHALGRLDADPPTSEMLHLFDRVRDPRITPKLIAHLDEDGTDRSALINTLARIGTSGIDEILADHYESLSPNEQAVVLTCLMQLRSPELLPLAESAMHSEHDAVFKSAARSLSMLADSACIEILAAQLNTEQEESRVSSLAKALEDIGTHQAARALEIAKSNSQDEKREIIAKQLLTWRLKSPGGQHLERADRYAGQREYEKAIKHYTLAIKHDPQLARAYSGRADCRTVMEDYDAAVADYTLALEQDPQLPNVYSNLGHCRLKLEDYKQAAEDFRAGLKQDPDDGQAVTGLGIALAILGDAAEGIQIVNDAEERFEDDMIFAYNAACVYGRALETIPADSPTKQQRKLREEYAASAISRLEQSLELGFQDLEWMKTDPDLASLRDFERFQELLKPKGEQEEPLTSDSNEPSTDD